MARIRHIAIHAHDTEALAAFYKTTFGLEEAQRLPSALGIDRIFLTDGHINLAILPAPADRPEGLNHFGFQVDSVDQAEQTALKQGAQGGAIRQPADGRGNEAFIKDPVGARVDLSAHGWPIVPIESPAEVAAAR